MSEYQEYLVREYPDGKKAWHNKNGELHRIGGPAIEYLDGSAFYYVNGLLHNEEGPAIKYASGSEFYYIKGVQIAEEEFNKSINPFYDKIFMVDGRRFKLEPID